MYYTIRGFYDSLDEEIQYCEHCICAMVDRENDDLRYCPICKRTALSLSLRD